MAMYEIYKSQVANVDFPKLVKDYIVELKAYAKHMDKVKKGKAEGYPPPDAAPEVKAAIDYETLKPNYKIINDDPKPIDVLKQKKYELHAKITGMEMEAKNAVLTPGKQRLVDLQTIDVRRKLANNEKLNKEEKKLLDDASTRMDRYQKIELHAAEQMAEVDDLTLKNIDDWEPEPFPD
jgi:hypothetical protein